MTHGEAGRALASCGPLLHVHSRAIKSPCFRSLHSRIAYQERQNPLWVGENRLKLLLKDERAAFLSVCVCVCFATLMTCQTTSSPPSPLLPSFTRPTACSDTPTTTTCTLRPPPPPPLCFISGYTPTRSLTHLRGRAHTSFVSALPIQSPDSGGSERGVSRAAAQPSSNAEVM